MSSGQAVRIRTKASADTTRAVPVRQFKIDLPLRLVGPALALGALFFTAAGAAIVCAKFMYRFDEVYGLYALFDLGSDASIPTWFSSLGLLICSCLLALNAEANKRVGGNWAAYWWVLAAIFLLLSVDEVARIHETLGTVIGGHVRREIGQIDGLLHYSWVISGIGFTAIVGIAYLRFLLGLSQKIRYGIIVSGVVYISGALIMEMFNARSAFLDGTRNLRYQGGTVVEEFLEMAGVALFAHFLILNLRDAALELIIKVDI